MKNKNIYIGFAILFIINYLLAFVNQVIIELCIYLDFNLYVSTIVISLISIFLIIELVFNNRKYNNLLLYFAILIMLYPLVNFLPLQFTNKSDIDFILVKQINHSIQNALLFLIALFGILKLYFEEQRLKEINKKVN